MAIRQYSEVGRGKKECNKTTAERNDKFKKLFRPLLSFGVDESAFEKYGHRDSPFDRNCRKLNGILSKWTNRNNKREYIEYFSPQKWKSLTAATKCRHSMEEVMECAIVHTSTQENFPGIVKTGYAVFKR